MAAVETTAEGKPKRVKIRRVKRFSKRHIEGLAKRIVERGTKVVTDGLGCFRGFAAAGCEYIAVITGSGRKSARHAAFTWVNTMLGNIKTALTGTFRHVGGKHTRRARLPSSSTATTAATICPR